MTECLLKETKMGKKFNTYIHRLAKTMVGQIGIKFHEFDGVSTQKLGSDIITFRGADIRNRVKGMSLQTRAKIAAQGKKLHASGGFSLEDVYRRSTWVNGSLSGEDIITLVATTAIIAAICDLMMEDRLQRVAPVGRDDIPQGRGGPYPAVSRFLPSLDRYDGNHDWLKTRIWPREYK